MNKGPILKKSYYKDYSHFLQKFCSREGGIMIMKLSKFHFFMPLPENICNIMNPIRLGI